VTSPSIAGVIRQLDDVIVRGEEFVLSLAHGLIAGLIVLTVFFRYILNDPLTWTEEVIVTIFAWMLFIGFSSGFHQRMHIRIDALLLALPMRGRAALGVIAVFATSVTLLGLAWFGAAQALIMLETETPMLRISAAWGVAALPVSAIFGLVHVIRHVVLSGIGQTLWPADIAGSSEGGHG
jgi:TRAP-type C4-dicarboxylate transport system permease small subunit